MRLVILAGIAPLALTALACGGDRPTPLPGEALTLTAPATAISVRTGADQTLVFVLTGKAGRPIAGERIEFAVLPENALAGATLSAPSALTDATGTATVSLRAGLPTLFDVSAQHPPTDPVKVAVTVLERAADTLSLRVDLESGFVPARPVVAIELLQFRDEPCDNLSWAAPPAAAQTTPNVALGAVVEVGVDREHQMTFLARGRDAGMVIRTVGCLDLSAGALLPGASPSVWLRLGPVELEAAEDYDLSVHIVLAKRNIATRVAAPWLDLTDCPLDPSQLWLDCAIDALGSTADDPLDCVAMPGAEGPLADAIAARRGPPVPGGACRPAGLADGTPSLDARLAALFPNPAQSPAKDLDALAGFAAHLLDDVTFTSTLTLDVTGKTTTPGGRTLSGTDTLRSATFLFDTEPVIADVLSLGLAESQARFIPVLAMDSTLTVGAHGLGARLGTLARLAFEQVVSDRLALPRGIGPLLTAVFDLASTRPGPETRTGCDALDAIVCGDIGQAPGCMRAACLAGQAALISRTAAAFSSADGEGADLQWGGPVDMGDGDGDGVAELLGPGPADGWTAQFRSAGPTETVSAELVGSAR